MAGAGPADRGHRHDSAVGLVPGQRQECLPAGRRLLRGHAQSIDGVEDGDKLLGPIFTAHRRCFDAHVRLLDPPAEAVAIPYEDGTLPGYLFVPAADGQARPTLIINNGSDGPVTGLWPGLGAAALARGYNALVFDGPGQQSMLFERQVPFRPDWEHVITPIVDFLLQRPEVDARGLALYGITQAGYWVPRALAFEHRHRRGRRRPGSG